MLDSDFIFPTTSMTVLYGALAVMTLSYVLFKVLGIRRTTLLPLPPGPKPLPFFGNALSFPTSSEWMTYLRWGKECGSDIIHVRLFSQPVIIINSFRIAKELLDRRSKIYSGRPNNVMLNHIMGCGGFIFTKQYGKDWNAGRILFHQKLHPSQTSYFQPQALRFVREYLHLYFERPQDFMSHNQNLIGAIATITAYGITTQKENDPLIVTAARAMGGVAQALLPGRFLVESFPLLRFVPSAWGWIPGARFKRVGEGWRRDCEFIVEQPFGEVVKDRMSDSEEGRGKLEPSFASRCLDEFAPHHDRYGVSDEEMVVKHATGNFYMGAVDTSVSSLETFFLAMVLYPAVQKKAQEQLDAVVPWGHLPDFTDEGALPYVTAIVREVLRWQPVAPVGLAHLVTTDDVFEGYHIPAKSIVVANAWAMLHDEDAYPEPHVFNPDRFIKDGQLDPDVRDPSIGGAFGFGRRICPASHMARSIIWIFIATFLKTMSIGKAKDENGKEIEPPVVYSGATVLHVEPFKCAITPRSGEAEVLLTKLGMGENV